MIKILGRLRGAQIGRIQARAAEHERRNGAGGEEGEKKKWKEISLEGEETRVVKNSRWRRKVKAGSGGCLEYFFIFNLFFNFILKITHPNKYLKI